MHGTIIRMLPNRGFCFIRGDDNISRFGHARAFKNPLDFDTAREGQGVSFQPIIHQEKKGGGARAIDIELLPAGFITDKL